MISFRSCLGATVLGAIFGAALLARATTATALSSFEGLEEPRVLYRPADGTFVRDDFVNITDLGEGTFRMQLRFSPDVWDGDRDTKNNDRQRAEVKGLGAHQKTGDTFDYTTTWRTNPSFRGARRFCHVFQLKATDGDAGAPLVTVSIKEGRERAELQYWPGGAKGSITARTFAWRPGEWQTLRIRIRTTTAGTADGEVLVSVDGDAFLGARGVAVYRPDATDYRPKWGLYRGARTDLPLGEADYVEHRAVSARQVGAETDDAAQVKLEAEALQRATRSPAGALAWVQSQPPSAARTQALTAVATRWAEAEPAAAMAAVEAFAPGDEARAPARLGVFNRWVDQAPAAALDWARARAPDPELDPLLWYFTTDTTLRYVDRAPALAALPLIGDSRRRVDATEHVVRIWARHEPAEAGRYVETTPALTDGQRDALLKTLRLRRATPE